MEERRDATSWTPGHVVHYQSSRETAKSPLGTREDSLEKSPLAHVVESVHCPRSSRRQNGAYSAAEDLRQVTWMGVEPGMGSSESSRVQETSPRQGLGVLYFDAGWPRSPQRPPQLSRCDGSGVASKSCGG